jgi:glutamine cyclotransferase
VIARTARYVVPVLAVVSASAASCSSPPTGDVVLTTLSSTIPVETDEAAGSSTSTILSSPTAVPPSTLSGPLSLEVVAEHPHDDAALTQGLELLDESRFVESTGLYGESDRRIVDIDSGTVEVLQDLPSDFFGEGLTIVDREIIQLTWRAGVYLRSDAETLAETGRGSYEGEGWGLCYDGDQLVMSDGTPTLTFRRPDTFEPIRRVEVTVNDSPLANLNELECVNGQVLANVWLTDFIVVIDPSDGDVVATLDASALRPAGTLADDSSFALNGIAHDPSTGRFYLTGKNWPVLYEVELS